MNEARSGRTEGIAVALSGGGYRAALYHCGALIRLNEMGVLSRLKRVSSVSGGSIVAGVLATRWARLQADAGGRFSNLGAEVIEPLREFCSRTLDVGAVLGGAINPFKTAAEELVDAYRERLGLDVELATLSSLDVRFVFNATNYATGVAFRFSGPFCGDYRIGLMKRHRFDVATAVAASSAFPPVFAPVVLDVDPDAFEATEGADLHADISYRRRLMLADGGVYDNMGLETIWNRYTTLLVSDGGKPFELDAKPSGSFAQLARVTDIGLNQALAVRKRWLIDSFKEGECEGAYWGIGTPVAAYGLGDSALAVSARKTAELAAVRTRLNAFSDSEQEDLVNLGYALSDAAVRKHVPGLPAAATPAPAWPHPDRRMDK